VALRLKIAGARLDVEQELVEQVALHAPAQQERGKERSKL
jgi:hypothetical protein